MPTILGFFQALLLRAIALSDHLMEENARLVALNASLEAQNDDLKAKTASLKALNASLEAQNDDLKAETVSLEAQNASLLAQNDDLVAEKANLKEAEVEAKAQTEHVQRLLNDLPKKDEGTRSNLHSNLTKLIVENTDLQIALRAMTRMQGKCSVKHPFTSVREIKEMIKCSLRDSISMRKLETPCIVMSENRNSFPVIMSLSTYDSMQTNSRNAKTFPLTQDEDIAYETRCTQLEELVETLKRVLDFLRFLDYPSFGDL
jgi:hypothetical protein